MHRFLLLVIGFSGIARGAPHEDEALRAVASVDPGGCEEPNLQPSAGGFVAHCGKDVERFYFVRVARAKAHVTKLYERKGQASWDVRPQSLNVSYRENGEEVGLSWFLGGNKPEIPDEIVRGSTICPPERYRDHYNGVAESVHHPTKTFDFVNRRVSIERSIIECRDGLTRTGSRAGLLIPIAKSPDGGVEVGRVGKDILARPSGPDPGIAFRIAAQPSASSLRLAIQLHDGSANPMNGGDPKTGDYLEIMVAPPSTVPTCDEALKMAPTCTAPVAPAPARIWIGRATEGKWAVTADPREAAANVSLKVDGDKLTVDLSSRLLAGSAAGLTVLYHDQASGTTIGTANPEKGGYSIVSDAIPVEPPPMVEHTVPLK